MTIHAGQLDSRWKRIYPAERESKYFIIDGSTGDNMLENEIEKMQPQFWPQATPEEAEELRTNGTSYKNVYKIPIKPDVQAQDFEFSESLIEAINQLDFTGDKGIGFKQELTQFILDADEIELTGNRTINCIYTDCIGLLYTGSIFRAYKDEKVKKVEQIWQDREQLVDFVANLKNDVILYKYVTYDDEAQNFIFRNIHKKGIVPFVLVEVKFIYNR